MTCLRLRATTVTILALIAASVSLTACGSGGKHVSIAPKQAHQDFAYAYQVHIDPNHPENGQWSTLVRMRPVSAGYRLSIGSPHGRLVLRPA
jgi:hypothetical protein